MGDHAPRAGAVHDPGPRRGWRILLPQSRARRGSLLHHQEHDRERHLAGRDGDRNADAGRRQDREEAPGAAVARSRRNLLPAGRVVHSGHPHRPHAARQGQGLVVPGAQEGRRYQGRSSGRHYGPELQRRIRRCLFGDLYVHRGRPRPCRSQGARRRHSPTPAAGSQRQQGRLHRRPAGKDLRRIQPHQTGDARHHATTGFR